LVLSNYKERGNYNESHDKKGSWGKKDYFDPGFVGVLKLKFSKTIFNSI
jgi:hypothetical protein